MRDKHRSVKLNRNSNYLELNNDLEGWVTFWIDLMESKCVGIGRIASTSLMGVKCRSENRDSIMLTDWSSQT